MTNILQPMSPNNATSSLSALHSDLVLHRLDEFLLLVSQSQGKFSVRYGLYDCVYAELHPFLEEGEILLFQNIGISVCQRVRNHCAISPTAI